MEEIPDIPIFNPPAWGNLGGILAIPKKRMEGNGKSLPKTNYNRKGARNHKS